MKEINYEKFLFDLINPLVEHPDDLVVKIFAEDDNLIVAQIIVNEEDIGRVIGKKGRVINSVRTIAHACAGRYGKKIEVSVDSF